MYPRYSPDGRWLAFRRNTSLADLWLMPAEGGAPRRLTTLKGDIRGWDWLPDGSGLVFSLIRGDAGLHVYSLADGSIRPLYGAGGGWEYYRDNLDPEKKHKGVPSNIFLARKEWFDANPEAVEFFLAMWEEGLKAWKTNMVDIIRLYPEDHGLDTEAETFDQDLEVMTKWMQEHDWFADTIYLDETWIEKERPLFDLMRKTGFMEEGQADPNFVAVQPPN